VLDGPHYLSDDNVTPMAVAPVNYTQMVCMYAGVGPPTDFTLLTDF
jgi:hypothetical protein